MKKLLLTSFLFLAAAGTLVAQNRKPKKMKLQTSKTERVALQNQHIAEKKAAKSAALNTDQNKKAVSNTGLSDWDRKQIARKQAKRATATNSRQVELAPGGNN
ncbi:MAG: hypothetical protein KIS82_03330 [Ferruginibacter sp.]|nr:hypothetical protein [Ferruginibacter sp.]